jgi:hypothetical protein
MQALEKARQDEDAAALDQALSAALPLFREVGLLHVLAEHAQEALATLEPDAGAAAPLRALSAPSREALEALRGVRPDLRSTLLRGLDKAVRTTGDAPGVAILKAVDVLADGAGADPEDLADALRILRGVGLERHAAAVALDIALLAPR